MMELKCRDMGMSCSFVAKGRTAPEVKEKLNAHGTKMHADKLKAMSKDDLKDMDTKMDELLEKQK